jgi:hypothetical protein
VVIFAAPLTSCGGLQGVDKVIGNAKMIGAHDAFIAEAHKGNRQAFAMHQVRPGASLSILRGGRGGEV